MILSIRLTKHQEERLARIMALTDIPKGTIVKMSFSATLERLEKSYGLEPLPADA